MIFSFQVEFYAMIIGLYLFRFFIGTIVTHFSEIGKKVCTRLMQFAFEI